MRRGWTRRGTESCWKQDRSTRVRDGCGTRVRHAEGVLDMGQSTLYPMLYNMEAQGYIAAEWSPGDTGRQRKYYKFDRRRKKRLADSLKQWQAAARAFVGMGILATPGSAPNFGGATP